MVGQIFVTVQNDELETDPKVATLRVVHWEYEEEEAVKDALRVYPSYHASVFVVPSDMFSFDRYHQVLTPEERANLTDANQIFGYFWDAERNYYDTKLTPNSDLIWISAVSYFNPSGE